MEAKYVALSTSCKDMFPLIKQAKELDGCLGLPLADSINLHIRIHKDNVGTPTPGKLEPHQITLQSKYYALK